VAPPDAENWTDWAAVTAAEDGVIEGAGWLAFPTTRLTLDEEERPPVSVAVALTVAVPAVVNTVEEDSASEGFCGWLFETIRVQVTPLSLERSTATSASGFPPLDLTAAAPTLTCWNAVATGGAMAATTGGVADGVGAEVGVGVGVGVGLGFGVGVDVGVGVGEGVRVGVGVGVGVGLGVGVGAGPPPIVPPPPESMDTVLTALNGLPET